MGETVDLNSRRHPVFYTVNIVHHYDGTIEFEIKDIDDDARSRDAVLHAFKRISGADHRIGALEKALRTLVNHCECFDECCFHNYDQAADCRFFKARAALEGKDGNV